MTTPAVKATLEFDLTDPDEQMAFERATSANKLCQVLRELDNELRNRIKHNTHGQPQQEIQGLEAARTLLYELCVERNINLDTL